MTSFNLHPFKNWTTCQHLFQPDFAIFYNKVNFRKRNIISENSESFNLLVHCRHTCVCVYLLPSGGSLRAQQPKPQSCSVYVRSSPHQRPTPNTSQISGLHRRYFRWIIFWDKITIKQTISPFSWIMTSKGRGLGKIWMKFDRKWSQTNRSMTSQLQIRALQVKQRCVCG